MKVGSRGLVGASGNSPLIASAFLLKKNSNSSAEREEEGRGPGDL